MAASNVSIERRKYPRFQTRQVFFAANAHLGMVENISLGGLAFRFIDRGAWPEDLVHKGILFGEDDLCLDEIPIRRMTSTPSPEAATESRPVQKIRVQFSELTPRQQRLLEGFIHTHT